MKALKYTHFTGSCGRCVCPRRSRPPRLMLSWTQRQGERKNPVGCSHWLLDTQPGGLWPEDEVPCSKCHKTWGTLLLDCVSSESLTSHTAYCCSTGTPVNHYLVHGASMVCPHCNQPRQEHVASKLSRICIAILATTNLYILPDDQRNREEFNSRVALWACYRTYPEQVTSALSDWPSSG